MLQPIANRPLLLVSAMLVLIGLQFLCFGLLAEILIRTYHESQNKKTYTVRNLFRGASYRSGEPQEREMKVVGG